MNVLDITGMKQRIENDYYKNTKPYPSKTNNMKDGYIADENKSVKWNKEQVELANQEYNRQRREYMEEEHRLGALFEQDVIDYIRVFHNHNEEVSKLIFNRAYEKSHSYGYVAVLDEVLDIADFIDLLRDKM